MEAKRIVRPDSTTIVYEVRYHLIKNQEEFNNVMSGKTINDMKLTFRDVDYETFQPRVGFEIGAYRYVIAIEFLPTEYAEYVLKQNFQMNLDIK